MTGRASTSTLLSRLFPVLPRVLTACAIVGVATSAALAQAEPTAPLAASTAVARPAVKTAKPAKKGKGTQDRSTAGKAKSAAHAANPGKTAALPATTAASNQKSTGAAKPSQVMDFDTDEVAGQRLEPGFELIEGAPAKARHKSLVEALKPGDSVMHRQ